MVIEPRHTYTATLLTTDGAFSVRLSTVSAPLAANNFLFLACNAYYAGALFDRTIAGRLVEGGDRPPTATEAPAVPDVRGPGYRFADQPVHGAYGRGVVAMAPDGRDRNGSRFFILLDSITLPRHYTIFGIVSDGLAVVDRISRGPVRNQPDVQEPSLPIHPARIMAITISRR